MKWAGSKPAHLLSRAFQLRAFLSARAAIKPKVRRSCVLPMLMHLSTNSLDFSMLPVQK